MAEVTRFRQAIAGPPAPMYPCAPNVQFTAWHLSIIFMIAPGDLKALSRARLRDAKVLFRANRYDAAAYICGYAIELALKSRICRTLKWAGFPETQAEFVDVRSFKTHDLEALLHVSGIEPRIRGKYSAYWNKVASWDPVRRYNPIGSTTRSDAEAMLESTHALVRVI